MPEISYEQQAYLKLGNAFLADLAPPGVLPSIRNPKTTREFLDHPDTARLLDAAISEIIVPIQRYYDVLHRVVVAKT